MFSALPGGDGIRLEGAIVVRDARGMWKDWHKHLAPLLRTEVGRAWEVATRKSEVFGVKTYEEWERILELADPAGGAVPLALAVFSRGEDFNFQALVKVAPGFVDRANKAAKGDSKPPWTVTSSDKGLEFTAKGETVYGWIDEAGWLRISPDRLGLVGGRGAGPIFEGPLEEKIRGADVAIFLVGGGQVTEKLFHEMEPGPMGAMLRGVTGLTMTSTLEDSGTYVFEIAGEAPMLKIFGPSARKPDLANVLAKQWDADATGFLSLSLPPPMLQALSPMVREFLDGAPFAPPEALLSGLSRLEGRLGFVTFGTPGDWGGGIQFQDAGAAADTVRGLHAWLVQALGQRPTEAGKTLRLELTEPAGRGPVLHLSPDLDVEGIRIFAKGSTLMAVGQAARYEVAKQTGQGSPDGGLVNGPLTPAVRATLREPALLLAYSIMSSDGRIFDWLAWVAKPAEIALEMFGADSPEAKEFLAGTLHRVGATMVASGFMTLMFYDLAIAADIKGGVVSLRFATSLL